MTKKSEIRKITVFKAGHENIVCVYRGDKSVYYKVSDKRVDFVATKIYRAQLDRVFETSPFLGGGPGFFAERIR